jgi:acetoin utilization deacetylase AcuC-like enzyme
MKRTGLLYDERFFLHRVGPDHPETPDRLRAIWKGVGTNGLSESIKIFGAAPADFHWIEAVHSRDYIGRFEETCLKGRAFFDHPDNEICEETYHVAMLCAGGVLEAARCIMEGLLDNAFCAVRPPGHHASQNRAMGFCFINNIAVAARYLQEAWGIERIGIIDFDAHHGNGTQQIFLEDPAVFYYSIHEHPTFAYPGTGREFERGKGLGAGFTLNSPMLPGTGDDQFLEALERDLIPAFDLFRPTFILVSAGFDGHKDDDMSGLSLSYDGFIRIMEKAVALADRHSQGRILSVLEGGYCIRCLPELASGHLKVLLDA